MRREKTLYSELSFRLENNLNPRVINLITKEKFIIRDIISPFKTNEKFYVVDDNNKIVDSNQIKLLLHEPMSSVAKTKMLNPVNNNYICPILFLAKEKYSPSLIWNEKEISIEKDCITIKTDNDNYLFSFYKEKGRIGYLYFFHLINNNSPTCYHDEFYETIPSVDYKLYEERRDLMMDLEIDYYDLLGSGLAMYD